MFTVQARKAVCMKAEFVWIHLKVFFLPFHQTPNVDFLAHMPILNTLTTTLCINKKRNKFIIELQLITSREWIPEF